MNSETTTTPESRGHIAYSAYGRAVGFTTWDDRPMPTFDELNERQRQGWIKAAQVVWDLAKTGKAVID